MKKLFIRFFLSYFIIIILLSSLIFGFSYYKIKNFYIDTLKQRLRNISSTLKYKVTKYLITKNYKHLDNFIKNHGDTINTRITIIKPKGKVVADSEKNPNNMENHRFRTEIQEALKSGKGSSLRFSKTLEEEMLYYAISLKSDTKIIGVLRLSLFLEDIHNLTEKLKNQIIRLTLLFILLSLIIAIIFSRGFSKPIHKLIIASKNVSMGNFKTKVYLSPRSTLRKIADNFNIMTEKLYELFEKAKAHKTKLINIIDSIKAPIIVLDSEGKITLYNQSFLENFNHKKDIKNKYYWEFIADKNFEEFIKKIKTSKKNLQTEIKIHQKVYLCSASPIYKKDELVIILHDITRLKAIETIKKDFISNVSHELKTPLTSIKGFTETIIDNEKNTENIRFLNIIKRNTERLINIVKDLLILSKAEKKHELDTTEFKQVNLVKVVKDSLNIFKNKLKKKNLDLKFKTDDSKIKINGDYYELEQVFINLIENAINYTEKGSITINLQKRLDTAVFTIEDTGIGIPEDDINRIFERFYVVDKTRSKKHEGTGLGLAIVKHIVNAHNGSINIESSLDRGTKFTIIFPAIS